MKNLIERAEAKLDEWGAKLEQKNIEYRVDLICGILFLSLASCCCSSCRSRCRSRKKTL